MTFIQESIDEFDHLLLSTIHNGDVTSLKAHLLLTSDPNMYLNRIYDEPNEQKCTLLMIACLNGYEDIVTMLLKFFKPDLEVLNIVQMNNDDEEPELYYNVTVLWVLAAMDQFSMVQQLIAYGANVNHTTSTNSTPFRCACSSGNEQMARYLVEKGADVNITKHNNATNLSLSVYRQHLATTYYLVKELECDVNECDTDGYSPLYFAVKCGSLVLVSFLLHYGARNTRSTYDQTSPLMLAAEKRSIDLVKAIASYCSLAEQIEAEELLGSSFACAEHGQCDLRQSFEHFHRALELRSIHNSPKVLTDVTKEVFNHRQECQTIDQLKELQIDLENMYTEALLVRERILGPMNEKYHYSIIYRGAILADNTRYDQAIALWLYELALHQQYSIAFDASHIFQFPQLFCEMIYESLPVPIDALLTVMSVVVAQLKHNTEDFDDNFHTVLFLITIISQPVVDILVSPTDRKRFYQLLHSVHKNRYVTNNLGSSLLHLSLSNDTSAFDREFINRICKYPCLHTARTLLQCGTDVNATNTVCDTPLHIFVRNSNDYDERILQLLCDAGVHLDYANVLGELPGDSTSNRNIKQFLQNKIKLNLKCSCARLIQKNNIVFHGRLSTTLASFVDRH